ncbi:MAG: ASCH domain-containing protein [Candidatus Buchananbacteria bacterium]
MAEYDLYVKDFVLRFIHDGSKDLEVRLASRAFQKIKAGDIIIFNGTCRRKIKAVRHYLSFAELVEHEDPSRIMPGFSQHQLLEGLNGIYGRAAKHNGVLVFEL